MAWMIALGALTLLAIMPLGVSALYDSAGAAAYLLLGPLRIRIFPGKPKLDNKKEKKELLKKAKKKKKADQSSKKGGSLTDFLPLLQLIIKFLGAFRRKLRVKHLEMNLVLAGDDPCDLARNYAKAWAVLGNLMPLLEKTFVICKRDLDVACDFTAEKTLISARLDLMITLGRLLALGCRYGILTFNELFKINNKRKGGAKA